MDSTFVWILMFAGAAVALLGLFLVASERELKAKRREIEALLAKLENAAQGAVSQSIDPEAEHAEVTELRAQNRNLQNELDALSNALERSRSAVAELQQAQQNSANGQVENQQLIAANDRLSREVNELRSRIVAGDTQIDGSQSREQEARAQMQAQVDDLRRVLSESHARIRELENTQQNLPDVNAIEAAHRQERESLQQRIAELAQQASQDREKLGELQTLRDRLAESENIQNELRDEIRRHEEEIPRWQARLAAGEESLQRLAALQAPCNEILSKQAALADRQQQLQDEMAAFARLVGGRAEANEHSNLAPTAVGNSGEEPNVSAPGSSERGMLDGSRELRAAQSAPAEPAVKAPPASSGTRYGILGALLFIAGVGVFAFQLFIADSDEPSDRTAAATKTHERSARAQLPEPAMIAKSQYRSVETSATARLGTGR